MDLLQLSTPTRFQPTDFIPTPEISPVNTPRTLTRLDVFEGNYVAMSLDPIDLGYKTVLDILNDPNLPLSRKQKIAAEFADTKIDIINLMLHEYSGQVLLRIVEDLAYSDYIEMIITNVLYAYNLHDISKKSNNSLLIMNALVKYKYSKNLSYPHHSKFAEKFKNMLDILMNAKAANAIILPMIFYSYEDEAVKDIIQIYVDNDVVIKRMKRDIRFFNIVMAIASRSNVDHALLKNEGTNSLTLATTLSLYMNQSEEGIENEEILTTNPLRFLVEQRNK